VFQAFGDTLRIADRKGTENIQNLYEQVSQRARDIVRTMSGGLNVDDPAIIRMLAVLHVAASTAPPEERSPLPSRSAPEELSTLPSDSAAEAFLDEVLGTTAQSNGVTVMSNDDCFFDELPSASLEPATSPGDASARTSKHLAALEAYGKFLTRHAKIPLVPYTRPDLGVTFFPTARFDAGELNWNYNGQVGGEAIHECKEDKLFFFRGLPLKSVVEFKNWNFTKEQKVSGTLWIWAVSHEEGKQMRFWFNNGKDRLRFYYTMAAKGVTQLQKGPECPGSSKFVKVAEKFITPIDVDI
jgi:hypothetical protein